MKSAFFYGTLMHPKILKRVIGNDGSHLQICPAVLLVWTAPAQSADYPGIIPYSEGRVLFDHDLDREACSVRGTMVTGLTASDVALLDIFEGSEYDREKVPVYPLENLVGLADYTMVETYVFNQISRLMPEIWDFEDFVQKNAWKWYGSGSRDNADFTEVDRRQAEA
ncbi:hypothetical protein FB451DRAFT_1245102 [Mycena latifolia]|nr:hypothetical protein FB451DRAFT_1245102 [Mycena latifolia]